MREEKDSPSGSLGNSLTIERGGEPENVEGETCSGVRSTGAQTTWNVNVAGRGTFPVWSRSWHTGERDIVLGRGEVVPSVPAALSALFGKRRAGLERHMVHKKTYMTVCLVLPDDQNWPRRRKCTLEELERVCGADVVGSVYDHGVLDIATKGELLGETGRNRTELCGILDPASESAPVALYVATRVVPTLRKVGWL
ncbi:hypothetical protein [Streptosporangium sp. NPDC006007]|uniref:hypothetical protein n=1 Tax=Streptosporangium sp. NPDC006007 TaxID=3154575 RepID=UPI0033BDF034